ncbi:MAG: serine/threonine-protein kinase [Cyanobacteria bacterium P01_G01_bin.19]
MDDNLVGQTIQGRYYVVKQLGRGGVGITFVAQDRQCFDSLCVVKQLKPKSSNDKTLEIARRLFNREAEIMNRLGHCDRIPRLLAYFEHQNDFFLVQELVQGHDLSEEIIAGQPWSEEKAIALLQDILEVLSIVQQYGVIHRDLKPSNLMRRDKDDKIVLIDFGSVKQVGTQIIDAAGGIKQTVAVGTKSYMPIEQMMGRPGFYSDIYAVGVIVIQALTGVSPKSYTVDQNGELIWRNLLDSQVSYQPQFLNILDKMVRYRHQERYNSAGVILSDLEALDAQKNEDKETILLHSSRNNAPQATPTKTEIVAESTAEVSRETKILPLENFSSNGKATKINSADLNSKVSTSKSRFKPYLAIATGLILVLGGIGSWTFFRPKNSQPEIELSFYESIDRGFRVNYPQAWSRQNRDDFFATGVTFFSPLENNLDRFKEQVSVLVENLPSDVSLEQYTADSISEIKKLSDPNVGEAKKVNLGEYEGRQIAYRGEVNGNPVRRMQTWSIKNNQAYVVTYTAQPESFDSYLPMVEAIIDSFETI